MNRYRSAGGSALRAASAQARPSASSPATSAASTASGSCASKTRTPWFASYAATLAPLVAFLPAPGPSWRPVSRPPPCRRGRRAWPPPRPPGGHRRPRPRPSTAVVRAAERDRPVKRDAVEDSDHALLPNGIERAEVLPYPVRHRRWRVRMSQVDADLEEPLGPGAGCGGQRGHELGEAGDRRRRRRIGQLRLACDGSPSQLFGRSRASHSSRSSDMTWMSQNAPSANIAWRSVPSCRKPAFTNCAGRARSGRRPRARAAPCAARRTRSRRSRRGSRCRIPGSSDPSPRC